MVINEKVLVREMKEAYNRGGYTVIARPGDTHVILCGYWAVEIDSENVPREVISLLALHMGFLPDAGEAYKITKTKEGPSLQKVMPDVALGPIRSFEQDLEIPAVVQVSAMKTILTYDGCNVWQKAGNCGIALFDPRYEGILRKKKEGILIGNALYVSGEISKAYIMRVSKDPSDPQINHLASMRWTVEK